MKPQTILLVEDNQSDIELTKRAMKVAHISNQLVVAEDGQEALDILLGTGSHTDDPELLSPAVVLLDLKLPKLNGLEVLRRLRANEKTRRLPVVILTSSSEQDDLANGYDSGANSYIRKPVDFVQFTEAIRHLGLYWLVLNEIPPLP